MYFLRRFRSGRNRHAIPAIAAIAIATSRTRIPVVLARFRHIPRPEANAALTSVVVSALLLGIKFLAYFLTGSAAIFSDALESIVNVAASSFAAYSLFLAHQPA